MVAWLEQSLREFHGALEDRDGASSLVVVGRKQVPGGARPAPPDPADAVQICGHVPRRATSIRLSFTRTVAPRPCRVATLPPLPQIVSGAAAKQRPVNSWFMAHQARNNPELTTTYAKGLIWGYVHLTLGRGPGDGARVHDAKRWQRHECAGSD